MSGGTVQISVIGCGYLGAVHAASMAELGHEVVGVDVDARKVASLSQRRPPFYEPGFEDLLGRTLESGRLRFTADVDDAAEAQLHFVCVGTPQRRGEYAADLRYVEAATESLIDVLKPGLLVVGKSTVPVGTAARLAEVVSDKVPGALLAWNPEFLERGSRCRTRCTPTAWCSASTETAPAARRPWRARSTPICCRRKSRC